MKRLLLLALIAPTIALARDNGQWAQADPAIHEWFEHLSSQNNVPCSSYADGLSVDDPDWRLTNDADFPYEVFLEGKWVKVPKTSVVSDFNKIGHAVVWPVFQRGGETLVRCFMPGVEI